MARMFEGQEHDPRALKDAFGDLEKAKEMRLEITKSLRQNIVDSVEVGGLTPDKEKLIQMLGLQHSKPELRDPLLPVAHGQEMEAFRRHEERGRRGAVQRACRRAP